MFLPRVPYDELQEIKEEIWRERKSAAQKKNKESEEKMLHEQCIYEGVLAIGHSKHQQEEIMTRGVY